MLIYRMLAAGFAEDISLNKIWSVTLTSDNLKEGVAAHHERVLSRTPRTLRRPERERLALVARSKPFSAGRCREDRCR